MFTGARQGNGSRPAGTERFADSDQQSARRGLGVVAVAIGEDGKAESVGGGGGEIEGYRRGQETAMRHGGFLVL